MPKFHYNLYFIFLLISIIYGCKDKDESIYFPLSEKIQWQYDRSIQYTRRAIDSKLIVESIGSEKVNDKTIFIKQNHAGEKTYFYQTDTKILRNAKEPYFEDISINEEAHFVMTVQLSTGDQ